MNYPAMKMPVDRDALFVIRREIQNILNTRLPKIKTYDAHFQDLLALAAECLEGGKLLRPRLVIGLFEALLGTQKHELQVNKAVLEIAAATEILHFAFLIHDDIIDEDLIRRGAPNLIGRLAGNNKGATLHWAQSGALLVGDLMLTISHQVFARVSLEDHLRVRALDLLESVITETVAGEYFDVSLADGCLKPELDLVIEMTRMKTAPYTFELPLRLACILAGANEESERILGVIGRHLGFAFQLQDDLLSAFGSNQKHGKDEFSDFREKKETLLMAHARTTQQWPLFEELLSLPQFNKETGKKMQQLLLECGAKNFVEKMIQEELNTALSYLSDDNFTFSTTVKDFILDVSRTLEGRTR